MRSFHLIILFSIYLANGTTTKKESCDETQTSNGMRYKQELSSIKPNDQSKSEDCPVIQKTVAAWCKGIKDIFTHDNGQFSKYACGCIEAILTHNISACKANEYGFPLTPMCGKVFKSNEFEQLSKRANPFSDLMVNVIFKHMFNVCDDKSVEEIDNFVKSLYVNKTVITLIEGIFKLVFSTKEATLITDCYKEVRTLIGQQ